MTTSGNDHDGVNELWMPTTTANECVNCGSPNVTGTCGGCFQAQFCSRHCQEKAWKTGKHNAYECTRVRKPGRLMPRKIITSATKGFYGRNLKQRHLIRTQMTTTALSLEDMLADERSRILKARGIPESATLLSAPIYYVDTFRTLLADGNSDDLIRLADYMPQGHQEGDAWLCDVVVMAKSNLNPMLIDVLRQYYPQVHKLLDV